MHDDEKSRSDRSSNLAPECQTLVNQFKRFDDRTSPRPGRKPIEKKDTACGDEISDAIFFFVHPVLCFKLALCRMTMKVTEIEVEGEGERKAIRIAFIEQTGPRLTG